MTLDQFSDTALAQLVRHCELEVEKRRNKLEEAVGSGSVEKSWLVLGGIQELRHLSAFANAVLRDRAKGQQ